MKKNGFTLIELLAVIVILAIIALIATPIILGIINDARKESNERSAELYASAVKNAIAAYQLTGTHAPIYFSDLNVQKDGDVECAIEKLYSDGSFYLAGCEVNGEKVDYTYGTEKYEPQYYSWIDSGQIGENSPSDAKSTVSELNPGYSFYLGFDLDSNKVESDKKTITVYVCFTKNETEYCLKGSDPTAYEANKAILQDAFTDGTCVFRDDGYINCHCPGLEVDADPDGYVGVDDGLDGCYVYDEGNFECVSY